MTVERYAAADENVYGSTRFSATINGVSAYVDSDTQVAGFDIAGVFVSGNSYQVSRFTFGMDEATATAVVTLLSGPITAAKVYPSDVITAEMWSISGGKLTVTIPANTNVWIEVNDNRGEPLFIFANDLQDNPGEALPGYLLVTYDGSQVVANTGETLYFPPGVHDLVGAGAWNDKLFPIASGADVLIDPAARVIGSFDVRGKLNYSIRGYGVLSGEWLTPTAFHALALPTFEENIDYAMIHGLDFAFPSVGGNSVRGITITAPPSYMTAWGTNYYESVKLIGPWFYNVNGFTFYGDGFAFGAGSINNCFAWCGDDVMLPNNFVILTGDNNTFASTGSAAVLIDYFGRPLSENESSILTNTNIVGTIDYYVNTVPPPAGVEGSCLIQCWVDQKDQFRENGFDDFEMDGIHIDGPVNGPIWNIKNRLYPWGTYHDAAGQICNMVFKNVVCVETPAERSFIEGIDSFSTPHNLAYWNIRIGGVLVTVRNYEDFFSVGSTVHHLSFGGRIVTTAVDVCNTALGLIGNKAKVTSISPVDGSAESAHCARFFPLAIASVLEMHNWSWATAKVELVPVNVDDDDVQTDNDDEAWEWRYEIPDDMVRAISILPDDATNDYLMGDTQVPVDFAIKRSNDDEDLRIYTNQEDAFLRYITREVDPNRWDSLFTMAVTWHLASLLAGPIVKGEQGHAEAQRCLQRAGQYLGEARIKDSSERQATVEKRAKWISGR